ncbi:MAG: cytochrome d ubiquinol oxidase subunit II [Solirubrobacterales bacterium]
MSLETVWFLLIAILWGGYFLLEGFDFGVGMLLPFLPRGEEERQTMFDAIGPVWDGNEVWLIVAGGATFAAFPVWYATMFSGFYLALLLVLLCLMVRVVSFEWRGKGSSDRWRAAWQWANTAGSAGAAFVWGVALSNLLRGVPIDSSGDFSGDFWSLFSPYTVFAGVVTVLLFAFHGANYLELRVSGALRERAAEAARRLAAPVALAGIALLGWTVAVAVDSNDRGVLGPAVPAALGAAALVAAALFARGRRGGAAFVATALATLALVATIFTGLYPRVLVSSTDFSNSLTISNASSSHYSLQVMTVVAAVMVPIVLLYQAWSYHVFRARLGGEKVGSPIDALAAKPDEPSAP